ncbi:MAG: hypothetical protein L6R36_005717 [Xanthoria steineri]|nr:MAG: hypothetical protein L6R36_005717 [Xanthoria steineri]
MQSFSFILIGALGTITSWATPTPSSVQVDKRVPADVTVNTPPQNTVTCAGVKTWDSAYMQEAIRQATDFKAQGLLQGKDDYPHVFHNRPQQYLDGSGTQPPFVFPNCPTGELLEFPLVRDQSRFVYYSPGKTKNKPGTNNPDRVIFTYQGPTEATYCGVLTHDGTEAKKLWKSDFLACDPLY